VSTASNILSADTVSTNNTGVTEPIEDGAMEPMQVNQSACNTIPPVQLEAELTNEAGNTTGNTRCLG